jgi:hypothetical protein
MSAISSQFGPDGDDSVPVGTTDALGGLASATPPWAVAAVAVGLLVRLGVFTGLDVARSLLPKIKSVDASTKGSLSDGAELASESEIGMSYPAVGALTSRREIGSPRGDPFARELRGGTLTCPTGATVFGIASQKFYPLYFPGVVSCTIVSVWETLLKTRTKKPVVHRSAFQIL